jgi:hypothetical protein
MGRSQIQRGLEGFLHGAIAGEAGDAAALAGLGLAAAVEGGRLYRVDLDAQAEAAQRRQLLRIDGHQHVLFLGVVELEEIEVLQQADLRRIVVVDPHHHRAVGERSAILRGGSGLAAGGRRQRGDGDGSQDQQKAGEQPESAKHGRKPPEDGLSRDTRWATVGIVHPITRHGQTARFDAALHRRDCGFFVRPKLWYHRPVRALPPQNPSSRDAR